MTKRTRYELHIGVLALILNENKVLLLKRSQTGWYDNFYSLPAGGLDEGETLVHAAVRETKEETGLDISAKNLKLVSVIHCNDLNEQWINVMFVTKKWGGNPMVCEPDKHSECKWFSLNNLPKNMIPVAKQAIDDYLKHNYYSEYGWDTV